MLDNKNEDLKDFDEKINNLTVSDTKKVMPNGKENIYGILAGIISLFNTIFVAVVVIKIPFFGKYDIGFFKGISEFTSYAKEIKNISIILTSIGILLIIAAVGLIYSSIIKNKYFIKYIIFSKVGILLAFYIYLLLKIPDEVSAYVSISFVKIFLYMVSIILAYISSVSIIADDVEKN
ncbi:MULTISPECIES: hypothetical protein [Fusobacterium]|uniref:hypothetical protein n=1 Tax=Fusobacterium TaxID=848 RepID=UPI0025BD43AE|nr:hypothetical protein [Fusobacterium sp.]MCI5724571.1 hypothetical protein [Fusobacterium sp.]MCI7224055.1 hypothetical protein [Fusobacterium sp.]MDD7410487.1 hypothetical protein [Fusobacteriaceae bacterium]MDY5712820.1 hypothetical protein [Fusobacterium gastrosuis]